MHTGFVLPSCNYNIILSEEDIKNLLEKGFISKDPNRINGTFRDEHGVSHEVNGHSLRYSDQYGEHPIQFVGIGLGYDWRNKDDKSGKN